MGVFGASHVLGIVYDKNTGRNGTQITSSAKSKKISDTRGLANLENIYETFEENIFNKREEWSQAFSKLSKKLSNLIEKPTKNTITGEDLTKKERETLRKVVLSFAVDSRALSDSREISDMDKNALNYFSAVSHAFAYYPSEVREIIGNDLADFLLARFMDETTVRSPIYTTG